MSALRVCQWLANTEWSIALHESAWVYPIVESVHVLTICIFVGAAMLLDLRLLGVTMRHVKASEVADSLAPWMRAGFAVMAMTGALLFYAIPVRSYQNIFFRIKIVLLVLAGINAWVFHATVHRRAAEWDLESPPPHRARLAGAASLVLWAGIVIAGRMIAYNWFDCDKQPPAVVSWAAGCQIER